MQFEINRKIFHMTSLILPILYIFTSKPVAIIGLLIIAGSTIAIDTARHYNPKVQELVDKFFLQIMRPHEKSGGFKLSGSSYMMAGFLITAIIFPKGVAIASWFVLIVSDSCAALFGRKMGTPNNYGKSFEGAAAFFVSAVLISVISHAIVPYHTSFWALTFASLAASAVEYYSPQIGIDDNLTIPISFAIMISILGSAASL
jgi:dolichol kinase